MSDTDIFRLNQISKAHRPAHSAALPITGKDNLHCNITCISDHRVIFGSSCTVIKGRDGCYFFPCFTSDKFVSFCNGI